MHGGRPDHVIFQSWHPYPDHALPDTDPATHTGLVNRYFGARSRFDAVSLGSGGAGELVVTRQLVTTVDDPVAGGSVGIDLLSLDGRLETLILEGVVPDGADSAALGLRVNAEGAGPGDADMTIHRVSYFEDDETVDRAPHFATWGVDGSGDAAVVASDRGDGEMLRLVADPDQELSGHSTAFTVTPGASHRVEVEAVVPDGSMDSGYAAVFFFGQGEVGREILPLAPQPTRLGTVNTDTTGGFALSVDGVEPGRYRVLLAYGGDLDHWPVYADHDTEVSEAPEPPSQPPTADDPAEEQPADPPERTAAAPSNLPAPFPGDGFLSIWPYGEFWNVPRLGSEPVRGSGCGSGGELGDAIPDGLWAGYVSYDPAADVFWIDVVCIYHGASAQAVIAEGTANIVNNDPDYLIVNNSDRRRQVANNVRVLAYSILDGNYGRCLESSRISAGPDLASTLAGDPIVPSAESMPAPKPGSGSTTVPSHGSCGGVTRNDRPGRDRRPKAAAGPAAIGWHRNTACGARRR